MRHHLGQAVCLPQPVRVRHRVEGPERVLQRPQRPDGQGRQQGQCLGGRRSLGLPELGARQAGPQQALGLRQQGLGQERHEGRAVAALLRLALRRQPQQLGGGVLQLQRPEDVRGVPRDHGFSFGGDQELCRPWGP